MVMVGEARSNNPVAHRPNARWLANSESLLAAGERGRYANNKMIIVEQIEHPFWNCDLRIDGYEGSHCPIQEETSDGMLLQIRIEFDDPDDKIVQHNYSAIRQRWSDIWSRIQQRTYEMKVAYGYAETPLRPDSDWFELRLPTEPIEENAAWSVMLQADEAGWLIDFVGWVDAGGQGVL